MASEKKEEQLKLYANPVCPFAHRAWIAVEAKKIPYEYIKCSLKKDDKEDFFKEAYSKALGHAEDNAGKVPIVVKYLSYLSYLSLHIN